MNAEPERQRQPAKSLQGAPGPSEGLTTPCGPDGFFLHTLSVADQRRLLVNLKQINSAIETFGETIATTVVPALTMAVQTPPSTAENTSDSISQAITDIMTSVTELFGAIDCFVRQGNEPLQDYRSLVEAGVQDAIRLLREANPSGDDETWRIKIHTATILLQRATSDDCEVITPNLLVMIQDLERLLASD